MPCKCSMVQHAFARYLIFMRRLLIHLQLHVLQYCIAL